MNMPKTIKDKIPVTVLTGFLGAGKTTLLNHILRENHGMKIAVIENEFGEIGIDGGLVVGSAEEIFEMTNGCVCCVAEARDDLLRVTRQLLARPERLDHIIIETSGLADPYPIAQTFFLDDPIRDQTNLDGVIALVDVRHLLLHLDDSLIEAHDNQAVDQIVCADRIILNKVDLASEEQIAAVSARVASLNQTAEQLRCSFARIDLKRILGLAAFDRSRRIAAEVGQGHDHHHAPWMGDPGHEHDGSLGSVGIELPGHMDPAAIRDWVEEMRRQDLAGLFRMKGVFSVQGDDYCYVLHGVHDQIEFRPNHPWGDEPRCNKMVFIGRGLDRLALLARLRACMAA
jgi:G3E family GTPase